MNVLDRDGRDSPSATIVSSYLEEYEDIIYAMTVKKVRPQTENLTRAERRKNSIAYEQVHEQRVKGGSLKRLVSLLGPADPFFLNAFLATYRAYSTPPELLELLQKRYNTPLEEYQALSWISFITNTSYIAKESGREYLQSGVVLCLCMNSLRAGMIPEVTKGETREEIKANIEAFREAVLAYGLTPDCIFNLEDLLDPSGDINIVYYTIILLSEFAIELYENPRVTEFELQDPKADVAHVLSVWSTYYSYDLADEKYEDTLKNLKDFATSNIDKRDSEKWKFNQVIEQCDELIDLAAKTKKKPSSCTARQRRETDFCYTDFDPVDFSMQLTVLECDVMASIRLYEVLGCGWSKKDKSVRAPTVMASIELFNQVSGFVTTFILQHETPEQRAGDMEWFISIAQECSLLNNFSSAKAILSGLQITSIHRLKKSWALVSKEKMQVFEELSLLLSETDNMSRLREALNLATPPLLPYLGMYLADLTYLDAANPTYLREGIINMDKCRKIFQIIQSISVFQQYIGSVLYASIAPNYSFHHWLLHYEVWEDDPCYALSLKLEPKESKEATAPVDEETPDAPLEDISAQKRVKMTVHLGFQGTPIQVLITPKTTASELVKHLVERERLTSKELKLVMKCSTAEIVFDDTQPVLNLLEKYSLNDQFSEEEEENDKDMFSSGAMEDMDALLALDPITSLDGIVCYLQEARGTICVFMGSDRTNPKYFTVDIRSSAHDVIQQFFTKDERDDDPDKFTLWCSGSLKDFKLEQNSLVLKYMNHTSVYAFVMGKGEKPVPSVQVTTHDNLKELPAEQSISRRPSLLFMEKTFMEMLSLGSSPSHSEDEHNFPHRSISPCSSIKEMNSAPALSSKDLKCNSISSSSIAPLENTSDSEKKGHSRDSSVSSILSSKMEIMPSSWRRASTAVHGGSTEVISGASGTEKNAPYLKDIKNSFTRFGQQAKLRLPKMIKKSSSTLAKQSGPLPTTEASYEFSFKQRRASHSTISHSSNTLGLGAAVNTLSVSLESTVETSSLDSKDMASNPTDQDNCDDNHIPNREPETPTIELNDNFNPQRSPPKHKESVTPIELNDKFTHQRGRLRSGSIGFIFHLHC